MFTYKKLDNKEIIASLVVQIVTARETVSTEKEDALMSTSMKIVTHTVHRSIMPSVSCLLKSSI